MAKTKIRKAQAGVIPGGTTGEVLGKLSGSDYDIDWVTPSSGIGIVPQLFSMETSAASSTLNQAICDTDGTLFTVGIEGTSTIHLYRFEKDASGMYYRTHTTSLISPSGFVGASTIPGLAIVGSNIFLCFNTNAPNIYLRRFAKADLSGITSFTFSGTAPSNADNTKCMYSDATDLYIFSTGTTWYRFTLSGTTATNAATITSLTNPVFAWSDGTDVFLGDDTTENFAVGDIFKYSLTGSLLATVTRPFLIPYTNDSSQRIRGFCTIDATYGYILAGYKDTRGMNVIMRAVTKP